MGFPLVCAVLIPKPVIAFCKLVAAVRDALLLLLSLVGLCRSPRRSVDDAPLPDEVKARLPAVEFGCLQARPEQQQRGCHDGGADAAAACIVCLERLEAADEVRRLGNCAHAFHRGCIDGWIDLGRTTCPLCRSHLLPRARRASLLTRVWWHQPRSRSLALSDAPRLWFSQRGGGRQLGPGRYDGAAMLHGDSRSGPGACIFIVGFIHCLKIEIV